MHRSRQDNSGACRAGGEAYAESGVGLHKVEAMNHKRVSPDVNVSSAVHTSAMKDPAREELAAIRDAVVQLFSDDPSPENAESLMRINAAVAAFDEWRDETTIAALLRPGESAERIAFEEWREASYSPAPFNSATMAVMWKAWRSAGRYLVKGADGRTESEAFNAWWGVTCYDSVWRIFALDAWRARIRRSGPLAGATGPHAVVRVEI